MKNKFSLLVFSSMFLISYGLVANQAIVQDGAIALPVDNSGQDRIAYIMSQVKHDLVPGVAAQISYVQSSNIDQDLNIKEIVNFFEPKTFMGRSYLQETLQRPVSPIDQSGIIELRKNIITQLIENPEFKNQVEDLLNNAAQQEKVAMDLMSNSFKSQSCSEIEELEILKKQNPWLLYPIRNALETNRFWKTYDFVSTTLTLPALWALTGGLAGMTVSSDLRAQLGMAQFSLGKMGFYAAYIGLITGIISSKYGTDLINAGKKRVRMHSLNQLIHVAEDLEALTNDYNLKTQFKISLAKNNDQVSLIEGLKASRYEAETSYCFDTSAVHTFLYTLYRNEDQLAQVFASIAEMDACNAIATKLLKSNNSNRKFCFAQIVESNNPQVVSQGFWNVLVPNAVINDIVFDQHVILTGPNAGGKTTSIRANLQNIVLAQTYGVAAAQSFEYTPFDVVLSYLNISDDLMNGLSLFASEIKRAKDLLEIIRALQPDQKLFFALDELFTGTAAEQGEKCAYEFIKKTAEFDGILFIYATHFDKLKQLGDQNIGLKNYKVDAPIKSAAGKLVYPFTVSLGASTINIAEDMAKEAGLFE